MIVYDRIFGVLAYEACEYASMYCSSSGPSLLQVEYAAVPVS